MTQPEIRLLSRYADAVAYMVLLHANQSRKSTTISYVSHLLGAFSMELEAGGDEDQAIAAFLHDGPEVQSGQATLDEIRERFGDRVATIVKGCTDSLAEDPENKALWKQQKLDYLDHLKHAYHDTLTVALAVKLHADRAIVTGLMIHGDSTWERFSGKRQADSRQSTPK